MSCFRWGSRILFLIVVLFFLGCGEFTTRIEVDSTGNVTSTVRFSVGKEKLYEVIEKIEEETGEEFDFFEWLHSGIDEELNEVMTLSEAHTSEAVTITYLFKMTEREMRKLSQKYSCFPVYLLPIRSGASYSFGLPVAADEPLLENMVKDNPRLESFIRSILKGFKYQLSISKKYLPLISDLYAVNIDGSEKKIAYGDIGSTYLIDLELDTILQAGSRVVIE